MGLGLATMPADAGSSRSTNFLFTCDGSNKTINVNVGGFPAASNQFPLGAEVTLFENNGGLQYILLRAEGDPNKQILSLGKTESAVRFAMPSFYTTTASAAGVVRFTIDGACNGGFGQVQGNVTIYFN
jgi:hypothetical protein